MRKWGTFLLLSIFPVVAHANPAASTTTVSLPIKFTPIENTAFTVGEFLKFDIKYQFVLAGTATMEVTTGPIIGGYPTLSIQSRAESTPFVDNFFKVRDYNVSHIDEKSTISLQFHQNLREGKYKVMRTTYFDYQKGEYTFEKLRKGKHTSRKGAITQPLHDILSAFFYARSMPLEVGKEFSITVFSDEDVYPLLIKVAPKVQTITVPAGKFDCLRLDPQIIGDGLFNSKEGKMSLWVTNDKNHMPVLIRSKVFIGSFDAELSSFSGRKNNFDTAESK